MVRQLDRLDLMTGVLAGLYEAVLGVLILAERSPVAVYWLEHTSIPLSLLVGPFFAGALLLWAYPANDYLFIMATTPLVAYLYLVGKLVIEAGGTQQPTALIINVMALVQWYILWAYRGRCDDEF